MKFTGERFIPGKSGDRIEGDHLERYNFILNIYDKKIKLDILDLACGEGYGSNLLKEYYVNSNVTGVDISNEVIEHAENKYSKDNLKFLQGDATTFFNNDYYDVIVSFETIEHVSTYEAVIENFSKLLKPNGSLFISSPNRLITSPLANCLEDKPSNEFHTQEFLENELSEILEKYGYKVENIFGQRQFPYFKSYFLNKVLNRLFSPNNNTSSKVTKLNRFLEPRYFIIEAIKK